MSKSAKKAADQAEREKVHKRYSNRREPDVIYPAKKQVDFYDADVHQRVAVYVRVSTDNLGQETSYELQKNYYEEFVLKHPNWKLVKIYADKGISGTSTKHRAELNQMLTDSRAGKIDLIITKSVSRLARNTVETVVLLSKGEIDSKKVRVEFSLEDMDMSGFQKGATYEQIKAYVLEHTGLKVSSLYISQIKRKCGLDVGQNYNLSKKEDAKVPKCPPEKEAAIRDALKYFQMI